MSYPVQYQGQQYQPQYGPADHAFQSQLDMSQPQIGARAGPYNMSSMANALPQQNAYRPNSYGSSPQRYGHAGPSTSVPMQNHANTSFAGPHLPNHIPSQQYYLQQNQMSPYYGSGMPPHPQQGPSVSPRGAFPYYPEQVLMGNQQSHAPAAFYYAHAGGFAAAQGMPPMMHGQFASNNANVRGQAGGGKHGPMSPTHSQDPKDTGRSNLVRGPPRKPKQSGHAIWIGNLPPQTDLMSLVHHVCKEAAGLESLFLISKSNCAFANFRDESACLSAQQKLHDSKFQSVRLVSRLRKSTVEGASGVTAPTGPAASASQSTIPAGQENHAEDAEKQTNGQDSATAESPAMADGPGLGGEDGAQKDRYFILKSLTEEDLQLSVQTGIWATQSHNEETLNNAFQSADNVYLIFSANKSGEYFGYAKMTSPINNDPAAAIEFAPKAQATDDVDLPKAIPTEATEYAPKGRIIDDSARGTIFWEAEHDETASVDSAQDAEDTVSTTGDVDDSASAKSGQEGEGKAWGKPFKLEWLSTVRLPFYRTRGLRNSWNSNREVKIARDGTELEPAVGKRLTSLFYNKIQSPPPQSAQGGGRGGPMGMGRGVMMMPPGYPPMHQPPFPR